MGNQRSGRATVHQFEDLAPREREVLLLMLKGLHGVEIAAKMKQSRKSVSNYKMRMMRKVDVPSGELLVVWAMEYGGLQAEARAGLREWWGRKDKTKK